MNAPGSVREALIAEAIGDLGRQIDRTQALQREMAKSRQALVDAHAQLAHQVAAFDAQIAALTEKAKVQAVKHILARTDEAARRSIELQGQAMADAARAAFRVEIGASIQRLQATLRPLIEQRERPWQAWFALASAAAAGSIATCAALALLLWIR